MKDKWVRGLLAVVAALLLLVLAQRTREPEIQAATGGSRKAPRGFASSIDQRNRMVSELSRMNSQVAAMLQLMNSGRLKVIVVELPDDKKRDK